MLLGALVALAPLALAARLSPDPTGLGTHQQLGLPPCSSRLLWDMRCPACGMTTSWAHLVRGEVLESVRANPGGMLLGLVAAGLSLVLSYSSVRGQVPRRRGAVVLAWSIGAAMFLAVADWGLRLSLGM
jgi:hypothetical protein